ncbi:MAG: hypothetical protein QY309_10960 [Cyclobacteriaceae bacterium]|jgi:hypothetical protein|nr:MAG: hypothetical protein QY309_10960 [Cyclobacteriaceae bacterium]
MNLTSTIKKYAEQIGGTFTEYDDVKCIIVVPLKDNRFQTVLAYTEKSKVSGKTRAVLISKVSDTVNGIDAQELLRVHANFDYSKFMIEDGHLKVEATCLADAASEEEIKFMVQEVAQLADQYEYKLTGKDIH